VPFGFVRTHWWASVVVPTCILACGISVVPGCKTNSFAFYEQASASEWHGNRTMKRHMQTSGTHVFSRSHHNQSERFVIMSEIFEGTASTFDTSCGEFSTPHAVCVVEHDEQ
jgi:hypothetical protein